MFHTTFVNMTGFDLVLLYLACQFVGLIASLVLGAIAATLKALFF